MALGEMTGRRVIYTDVAEINKSNIAKVLQDAYTKHLINAGECDKLLNYEAGIQPLPQVKLTRTDIDAHVVDNVANEVTEFKCAFVWGNTVTLVQRGENDAGEKNKDENKGISLLNEMYAAEFGGKKQQELARYVEICGAGYTFVDVNTRWRKGKSYFTYDVLDPRFAFVVRSSRLGHRVMLGVTYSTDAKGNQHFTCFTEDARYEIDGIGGIVTNGEPGALGLTWQERERNGEKNPLGMIPIIEWERASDRMGCFERQLDELDNLNQMVSDLSNGIRQNTNSLWWANNVEFPEETVLDKDGNEQNVPVHPDSGDWIETATTRDGKDPKIVPLVADYDYEGQLNNILARRKLILQKCHVPQRGESSNSTGLAVSGATGWDAAEADAVKEELFIEGSKMQEVEVVLSAIEVSKCPAESPVRTLTFMDVKPSIQRRKNYDLVSKANFFATGISHGLHPRPLIQAMDTFGDPEQVYLDSKPYLDKYVESTFAKDNSSSDAAYNGYGFYSHHVSDTGEGGSGEKAPNADRLGQDESDQIKNSPNLKG